MSETKCANHKELAHGEPCHPRDVTVLGSTGSIGRQTLDVIRSHPGLFRVVGLSGHSNEDLLVQQCLQFRPQAVSVSAEASPDGIRRLSELVPVVLTGPTGLAELAGLASDIVVIAVTGIAAFEPAYVAASRGCTLALANKESVVAGGSILMEQVRRSGATLIPVDSEHSAIFQCLKAGAHAEVDRLILTASGGPFLGRTREQMREATVRDALAHPNWSMGRKITVDSATLMNKGLEVIEAHHLFSMPYDRIDVIIHKESIIHSMVEFVDCSVIALMGVPDMRIPIQYALTYPGRLPGITRRFMPSEHGTLSFSRPDTGNFPLLALAYETGRRGGIACTALSSANEVAVEEFLNGSLAFIAIADVVSQVASQAPDGSPRDVQEIIEVDAWARGKARSLISRVLRSGPIIS